MKSYNKGKFSEFFASILLISKGYKILKKRFVIGKGTHAGEIDLIAKRGKNLVFIEVKSRRNKLESLYAINKTQKQRIARSAEIFLKYNPRFSNYNIRFDAILFAPFYIKHIKNAWTTNDF